MRPLSFLVVCLLVAGMACSRVEQPAKGTRSTPGAETEQRLATLLSRSKKAEKFVVYEGLPHQNFEPELLAQEQKAKETLTLHRCAVYKEPLKLKPEDQQKIQAVLLQPAVYKPWRGEKKCGGFHADYCLEWYCDGQFFRALVCFGCGEILLVGPDDEKLYDIDYRIFGPVGDVLLSYRQQRPDSESWQHVITVHGYQKKNALSD